MHPQYYVNPKNGLSMAKETHVFMLFGPPCICHLFNPLGNLLAEFGFVSVISPVSVPDKAASDDFDLRADLDLICELINILFLFCLKNFADFNCRPAHFATAVGSRVRQRGQCPPPHQRGAFGWKWTP